MSKPQTREILYSLIFLALSIPIAAVLSFPQGVRGNISQGVYSTAAPISVNMVISDVIQAPTNTVYFGTGDYSDPTFVEHVSRAKCNQVSIASPADSNSITAVYGSLANSQYIVLDTDSNYFAQSSSNCGQPLLLAATLFIVGGPGANEVTKYYEQISQEAPIFYSWNGNNNNFVRRDTNQVVAQRSGSGNGKLDYFVIEAFKDSAGRSVYLAYGFTWRGSAAANLFLSHVIEKNPTDYSLDWYVFRWDDATSGPSANFIPDNGDNFTLIADTNKSPPPAYAGEAWQYFSYGNGINANSKLPRGWIGGDWFNFWDFGMAVDGTVAAYKAGLVSQTDYQSRINALLSFLENAQLNSNGVPFYSYKWDTGAPASSGGMDAADTGRTLNALGFLRRSDPSYASRIDSLLTGRLKAWIGTEASWAPSFGVDVYGRDASLGLTYFRYLNSQYDRTSWLNNFYNAWTSSDRVTDAYGNSMPKVGANLGPVSYELFEKGDDYATTLRCAQDMMGWAAKRYAATGKASTWGSEFHVKLSDGSTPFGYESYVTNVPNVGYKTWQVTVNGQWYNENDPGLGSTVSSIDAAYALHATFPTETWVNSMFPRFTQSDMTTTNGFYESLFEVTNNAEAMISIPHNAVVLLASIPA